MTAVRQPVCQNCPYNIFYAGKSPQQLNGVIVRMGERYCAFGKKARKFGRRDPTQKVPDWCPKRKQPCELRVYAFRSNSEEMMDAMLRSDFGRQFTPSAHRYVLHQELHTDLSPAEFWRQVQKEHLDELIPAAVLDGWVIEIDDGLKPVFFYRTGSGFVVVPYFNTATIIKNGRETM